MNEPCYYRVSVKGLVVDETGRFLLIQEADRHWELPGGGLEHGEEPAEGLQREITEETGLVVTGVAPAPAYVVTARRAGYDSFTANIIYHVTLRDLAFTPSEECQALRFFTTEEANKVPLTPVGRAFLKVYDPRAALKN